MMTDREKLLELIHVSVCDCDCEKCECSVPDDLCIRHLEEMAVDHLIANGVTFADRLEEKQATSDCKSSDWISVTERLPEESDADDDNCVLAIHKATKKRYFHWRSVADNPFDFTHWMPTPEPPKED